MCRISMQAGVGVEFTNRDKDVLSLASGNNQIDFCVFKADQPDVMLYPVNGKDGENAELFLHALAAHLGFTVKKIGE